MLATRTDQEQRTAATPADQQQQFERKTIETFLGSSDFDADSTTRVLRSETVRQTAAGIVEAGRRLFRPSHQHRRQHLGTDDTGYIIFLLTLLFLCFGELKSSATKDENKNTISFFFIWREFIWSVYCFILIEMSVLFSFSSWRRSESCCSPIRGL